MIRQHYGRFTAMYDGRTVACRDRNTAPVKTLQYGAKTAVYGAVRQLNARLRLSYDFLR